MRSSFKIPSLLMALFALLFSSFTVYATTDAREKQPPGMYEQLSNEEVCDDLFFAPNLEVYEVPVSTMDVSPYTLNNYDRHYLVWGPGGFNYNYVFVVPGEVIEYKRLKSTRAAASRQPVMKPADSYYGQQRRSRH